MLDTSCVVFYPSFVNLQERCFVPKSKKWIKRTVVIIVVGFLVVSNIRFSESEKQWRNNYICILLVPCHSLIIGWPLKSQQEFIHMERYPYLGF